MLIQTRLLFWCDAFTLNSRAILVHPVHAGEKDLIAHEECHQAQMRAYGWLRFVTKYLFSRKFRQQMEVEAYQVQIKNGASTVRCAYLLSTKYRLPLTHAEAVSLLRSS